MEYKLKHINDLKIGDEVVIEIPTVFFYTGKVSFINKELNFIFLDGNTYDDDDGETGIQFIPNKDGYFKTPQELNEVSDVSDSDFIFNLLEKMLNKQEEDVIYYMDESMTKTERNRHGDNIYGYLLRAQGALAKIRLEMIADGRKIK